LTSGIVALLFSTVILMNIMNGAIFMGNAIRLRVVLGSCFGITGIASIFWSEVSVVENTADTWRGLWMCLIATYFASVGNILSARKYSFGA
jgi:drug/metabolite transporter (DMT)-like permease